MANATDRKDIRRREKEVKLAEQNRGAVVKNLMGTAPGRTYVWDRLAAANIFAACPVLDPCHMAFFLGERNQGLQLLSDVMQYAPDEFIQAMREANGRRTDAELLDKQRTDNTDAVSDPADGERPSSEEPGRELEEQPSAERPQPRQAYQHPDNDPEVRKLFNGEGRA